jgi:hypothetical protein
MTTVKRQKTNRLISEYFRCLSLYLYPPLSIATGMYLSLLSIEEFSIEISQGRRVDARSFEWE